MSMETFHPDHLKPGDMVGPWQIVESLGSGSFGRAFKAELAGEFFTLKMAVRPAPELSEVAPEQLLEERQVDGRMCHEGAVLLANSSTEGLPHLRGIGRWPHPKKGFLYLVTDFVPGQAFHHWREHAGPTAAQLVDIFIAVVRVVAELHGNGILIRDFKSAHVIVPEDGRPTLIDLGSAWLPGGSTLTVGLAPATPYALPPECIAFLREGTWKQGARFSATEAGDLYQLGVFMYEALTDGYPFDPRMPDQELLTAIQSVVPRAPHRLNPAVPASLSRIALRLLEKRPEDRYESAEVLLQALWEANKERATKEWKTPLDMPPEGPAEITQDEVEERRLHQQEVERRAQQARQQQEQEQSLAQMLAQFSTGVQQLEADLRTLDEKDARRKRRWRRIGLGVGLLVLSLGLFAAGWEWLAPASLSPASSEKGSSLVSTLRNSWPVRTVAAWLCTSFSVGCAAPQQSGWFQPRPPPEDCPQEAVQRMEEMQLFGQSICGDGCLTIQLDVNQPGRKERHGGIGVFQAGKLVSRVVFEPIRENDLSPVPEGTRLYGQMWTEGLTIEGVEAVYARYTEMQLPDGRRFPVCYVLGSSGYMGKRPGSKPDEPRLYRHWDIEAVRRWP